MACVSQVSNVAHGPLVVFLTCAQVIAVLWLRALLFYTTVFCVSSQLLVGRPVTIVYPFFFFSSKACLQ